MTESTSSSGAQHRFMPLLISLVIVLAASPVFEIWFDSFRGGILDSLVLLAGVWAMTRMRWITWLVAVAGMIAFTLLWLVGSRVLVSTLWSVVTHLCFVAYLAIIGGFVLRNVMRANAITRDTIRGGICVYLLIGVTFSILYSLADLEDPEAFSVPVHAHVDEPGGRSPDLQGHAISAPPQVMDPPTIMDKMRGRSAGSESVGGGWYMYFSFTTLTTLGYGDITPVSPFARTLAMIEAVIGPLYLAILIARLVGMHASTRARPQ